MESFQGMFNGSARVQRKFPNGTRVKRRPCKCMFKDAINFNQDISDWDTSKVESFVSQFEGAEQFNQAIGKWNTDLRNGTACKMFQTPSRFAQGVSSFTGQASTQNQGMMFSGASAFHAIQVRHRRHGTGGDVQRHDGDGGKFRNSVKANR